MTNTGHLNTGDRNTGDYNTGDRNTGDYNTGDRNTGDYNTGDRNTGDYNTGHLNTGYRNTGHLNTGYRNTGDYNTGDRNTGDYNTGDYNTGYCNTGDRNTGDYNTGDYNTGYCNTGHYNTGDLHTGSFNTCKAEYAYFFNSLIPMSEWEKAPKPHWISNPRPTTWVPNHDMTPKEKEDHPKHKTTGGYLRTNDMKAEWKKAYESATEEEIQMVRDLPGFDYGVFEEITGLDLRKGEVVSCDGREIEIDGKTYTLTLKK